MKKITIKEIAKKSGFSKSTVSRVLSKNGKVKNDTRDKILEVVKELEFHPNIFAQSLRSNKSNTIGLILADIENPFYSRLAKGVLDVAQKRNYNVIIANSDYDIKLDEKNVQTLINRHVDGLLITSIKLRPVTLENLLKIKMPLVLLDYKVEKSGVNYILNDDYFGGRIVAEYLLSLGHKKFGFLGHTKLLSFKQRRAGYRDVIEENGNGVLIDLKVNDINDIVNICKAIRGSVNGENKVSAIFAANDFLAIKVIDSLLSMGFKVPRDISVIGYDNISIDSLLRVPLTTINQPKYRLGKIATEYLLDFLSNKGMPPLKTVLKPELIIRQSCIEI